MKPLFQVCLSFASAAYRFFAYGFVLSRLWQWFAVAPYAMAPIQWQTFGALCFGYGLVTANLYRKFSDAEFYRSISTSILLPWAILLTAWFFK